MSAACSTVDADPFGDEVAEATAINVDDRGPGDDGPTALPGMFPTPQAAIAVLGITGAISLVTAYAAYRGLSWLVTVLS